MNRKNRKEKEQNTDVSKQICVHKTQNTLLEFNSFLRMAEPKDFWHLHEDIASDYSRIRAVMVDYSKGNLRTFGREWCGKNHADEGSYNRFKTNGRNGFP